MVKNTIYFLNKKYEQQYIQINITFPTNNEKIIETVRIALENNPDIKLATFSHITSIPAIILPIESLISLCHEKGVMVSIDGAHALGQIPINLNQLNPDFYLSNGHKWLYTPKSSAFLWVRKDKQHLIYPPVISNLGQGKTFFQMEFSWLGTMDYSSYLCFPIALKFREKFGDNEIMKYIHSLAVEGGNLLVSMWKTSLLVDHSMIGSMVNIELPFTENKTKIENLSKNLLEKYHTFVPVFELQEKWYIRVSAQIYNEISDFEYLGKTILQLLQ
jgi:selenocysteine lyase/cysteine desulfurase